jgi:predicted transcriptional regulator
MSDILMPIKPKWAEKIYKGEKNIEVRKVLPANFGEGKGIIYLYESSPVQRVTGFIQVETVYRGTVPSALDQEKFNDDWRMCLTEKELIDYASGRPVLNFIKIFAAYRLKNPVKLVTAPQSFFYVSDRYAKEVLGLGEGGFNA